MLHRAARGQGIAVASCVDAYGDRSGLRGYRRIVRQVVREYPRTDCSPAMEHWIHRVVLVEHRPVAVRQFELYDADPASGGEDIEATCTGELGSAIGVAEHDVAQRARRRFDRHRFDPFERLRGPP